jgi:hypothetical protein
MRRSLAFGLAGLFCLGACSRAPVDAGDAPTAAAADKLSSKDLAAQIKMVAKGQFDSFVLGFTAESPADKPSLDTKSAVDVFTSTFDMDDAVPHFEASATAFRPVIFVTMPACKGVVRKVATRDRADGRMRAVLDPEQTGGLDCPDFMGMSNQDSVMRVTSLENLMKLSAVTAAPYELVITNDE